MADNQPAKPSADEPTEAAPAQSPQPVQKALPSTVSLARPQGDTSLGPTLTASPPGLLDAKSGPRFRIPHYEIIEEVARGGMGVVYKARHAELNRTVALKMMLAGNFASPEVVERFRAEARAVAQLEHSGIVPIYDIGEVEGQNFFAMQFVAGGTLAQKLAAGPLANLAAAQIVQQVAEAVHHAHTRGIIHRDLKPGNVLLDETGQPKVTDFGLAKQLEGTHALSLTGDVMGTPPYMAPEQAAGKVREIGPATDVYALGAILYATLTGRPPFAAATPLETLRQVIDQEPVSPRLINGGVKADLETICLKCLQKDAAKRYATAADLAADLGRFLCGEPILARPIGRVERTIRWCRRHPLATGMWATVALAIVAVVATLSLSNVRIANALANESAEHQRANLATANATTAKNNALHAQATAVKAEQATAAALNVATTNLNFSRLRLAHQHWRNNDVPEATLLLDRCPPQYRDWEWHYVRGLCQAELASAPANVQSGGAQYSSDDRWLVVALDGLVYIWDAETGKEILKISLRPKLLEAIALSPDGKRLAGLVTGGPLLIWDAGTGDQLLEIPGVERTLRDRISFSPDNRLLLGPRGSVYDVASGKQLVPPQVVGTADAVWAPSGEWFVTSGPNSLEIWTPTGELIRKLEPPCVGPLAVSPDSKLIARGWPDGADIIDATTGVLQQAFRNAPENVLDVCFSRDGSRLAVAGSERSIRIWKLVNSEREVVAITGTLAATLRGHLSRVRTVAFNGDGTRLASVSNEGLRIWDPTVDPEVTRWETGSGMKAFDATGRKLISLDDQSGGWRIYDVATRKEILRHAEGGKLKCVAHEQRGDLFATGGPDGISVWNSRTGKRVAQLPAPPTTLITIDPLGGRVVSAGDDNIVRLWDLVTKEQIAAQNVQARVFRLQFVPNAPEVAILVRGKIALWNTEATDNATILPPERVLDFDINLSGTRLATAHSVERGVQIWDLPARQLIGVLPSREHMSRVAFHPTSPRLAACNSTSTVREVVLWDLNNREELVSYRESGLHSFIGQLGFSPDGRWLLGHGGNRTRLWDGRVRFRDFVLAAHSIEITGMAFTPDGNRLVSASLDRTIKVWDLRQGTEESVLKGPKLHARGLPVSPDGQWVAAGGDSRVHVWNISGGPSQNWQADEEFVDELALSPDGKSLAVIGNNDQVRLYEPLSGRLLRSLPFDAPQYSDIAFHPRAASLMATGGDGKTGLVVAWNPASGEKIFSKSFPANPLDLAFSPSGDRFAVVALDGAVNTCDSRNGDILHTHNTVLPLYTVAWSADNRWIAAGGQAHDLWIWDAQSNREVALLRQAAIINNLVFSPDNKWLAVGTFDGLIRLIPADWKRPGE